MQSRLGNFCWFFFRADFLLIRICKYIQTGETTMDKQSLSTWFRQNFKQNQNKPRQALFSKSRPTYTTYSATQSSADVRRTSQFNPKTKNRHLPSGSSSNILRRTQLRKQKMTPKITTSTPPRAPSTAQIQDVSIQLPPSTKNNLNSSSTSPTPMQAVRALIQEVDVLTRRSNLLSEDKEFLLECARVDREEAQDQFERLKIKYEDSALKCSQLTEELNIATTQNQLLHQQLKESNSKQQQLTEQHAIELDHANVQIIEHRAIQPNKTKQQQQQQQQQHQEEEEEEDITLEPAPRSSENNNNNNTNNEDSNDEHPNSDNDDSSSSEKEILVQYTVDQVLRDLESVGANNRSHDLDRQLLIIQRLIDVITADDLQDESPYSEEDDVHTWGRVSILVGRLLSSGIRAAKRSVTFTTDNDNEFNEIIFHCKFRDERTSSLVENCIVAAHTLGTLPYVASSMNKTSMKTFLIRIGRSKGSLSNSQFFTKGMTPSENGSWPNKMSDMIMQTGLLYLKQACEAGNDAVVAQCLMELLLEAEPRVPIGGNPMLLSPRNISRSSTSTNHIGNGTNNTTTSPSTSKRTVGRSYHMADDILPPRSPMRQSIMSIGDLTTPPSSPTSLSLRQNMSSSTLAAASVPSPSNRVGAPPPLARFVIELVDELIQPEIYGGIGGPAELFSNIPMSEFLKILSNVYKQNKLECMAVMDAILEYTCQCRHEEMLVVVALLSEENDGSGGSGGSGEPDELEKFTMSKVQETAEYWRDVEIYVIQIQCWYLNIKNKK